MFTEFQSQSEIELVQLEKKIGSSVTKAKVYYDARMNLYNAKLMLNKAKDRFERAQALHIAAKELALASVTSTKNLLFDFTSSSFISSRWITSMKQKNRTARTRVGVKRIDMRWFK